MAYLSPNNGGCWFCQTNEETDDWMFSVEWDTYYHDQCYRAALEQGNPEAVIIYKNERR